MLRVASVPSSHPYVRNLQPLTTAADSLDVQRLPDPRPPTATSCAQWWPPRYLEPEWLLSQIDTFDIFHLHFGFDDAIPEDLHAVAQTLRDHGKAFVYTAHDLHNPHFVDDTRHRGQLDIIMAAADEVITLTDGAAREIAARWGRRATVIAHPHVVPLQEIGDRSTSADHFVIGLHAKNLRANMDPLALLDTLVSAARSLPGSTVRVDVDDTVLDPSSHWYSPTIAHQIIHFQRFPGVDVHVHPRFDDAALWEYFRSIDVLVLPYRFGTHSGWLEASYDLGCAVIAPDCGYFSDQHPCETYVFGTDRFDPLTLVSALERTHAARSGDTRPTRVDRSLQRRDIAALHEFVYQRALEHSARTVTV